MFIASDKLNCYIEGIRIPIQSIDLVNEKNNFATAIIRIAIGSYIDVKMWANAYIQVTYITDFKEKLFFDGLVQDLDVTETTGIITIFANSIYSCLNFNTNLDYTAPKRYGINNLEGEITVYIGNEDKLVFNNQITNYQLSRRYFYLPEDQQDEKAEVKDIFKLQYIIDKTPLAERFFFSLLEDISYQNFILSQSYINRFKLLRKTVDSERVSLSERVTNDSIELSRGIIKLDITREALSTRLTPAGTKVDPVDPGSKIINLNGPISDGLQKLAQFIKDFEGWIPPSTKNPNGSRSYKNNNPGNIEFGDFAKQNGSTHGDPRFAIFPDATTGFNALMNLIRRYASEGHTITTMMNKYAPPSENDTKKYIQTLASRLGVDPNTSLKSIIGN